MIYLGGKLPRCSPPCPCSSAPGGEPRRRMHPSAVRLDFLTHPFKARAALWLLRMIMLHIILFGLAWAASIAAGDGAYVVKEDKTYVQEWGLSAFFAVFCRGLMGVLLCVAWAWKSISVEPYEFTKNALDSRLHATHLIFLILNQVDARYNHEPLSTVLEACIFLCVAVAPAIGVVNAGLLASHRSASAVESRSCVAPSPSGLAANCGTRCHSPRICGDHRRARRHPRRTVLFGRSEALREFGRRRRRQRRRERRRERRGAAAAGRLFANL